MDTPLKQRLLGATVLLLLAVIFLPLLLDGAGMREITQEPITIPEAPELAFSDRLPEFEPIADDLEPIDHLSDAQTAPENDTLEPTHSFTDLSKPMTLEAIPRQSVIPAKPVKAPKGNWAVQVASFQEQTNADRLRDKLRNAGYSAFVETSQVKGKNSYRVRLGPHIERDYANQLQKEIKQKFGFKGLVVKYP